jgi:hypothetical protein
MAQFVACERVKVKRCPARIPVHYSEALEHNQKLASCCRHPENHEIEAWFSDEKQKRRGVPDIYIFHCECGRKHRRFCVGGGDRRPFWQIR